MRSFVFFGVNLFSTGVKGFDLNMITWMNGYFFDKTHFIFLTKMNAFHEQNAKTQKHN